MALPPVELFLLNLPLMKASAAKERARQRSTSRLAHRASGPSRSYPKTRVRASRLYEAAFILAFIELSRRLHQAYEQAYDKQAADKVLPQNPSEPQGTFDKAYADCKGQLGNSVAPGLAQAADILMV
ncbi:MAG: hypothetical protein LC674_00075, partial [Actinobacteria bacterium]|nr:hypothetical protein [Actinomycetota bacterium]